MISNNVPTPSISKALIQACIIFSVTLILIGTTASAQVLQYNFNDAAGTTVANSGSVGSIDNLTMESSAASATDYLSPYSSGGVVGPDGSGSLNLTSATGNGSSGGTNSGPWAGSSTAGAVFNSSQSFTISGWYNAPSPTTFAGDRILQTGGIIFFLSGPATFALQVGSNTYTSTQGTGSPFTATANAWTFFAATYNQSSTGTDEAVFYEGIQQSNGTLGSLVSWTDTTTVTGGAFASVALSGQAGLSIGNDAVGLTGQNNRPFQGSFDQFNVYDSSTDNTGALNGTQVAALYATGVPEPSTLTALAMGAIGLALFASIQHRRRFLRL